MSDHQSDGNPPSSLPALQRRLAKRLPIERTWLPDREAMLAALRVVLRLPRVPRVKDGDDR